MELSPGLWHKSSYSGNNGGACVEAATVNASDQDRFLLRDSQHPNGSWLACSPVEWHAFVTAVKGGEFEG